MRRYLPGFGELLWIATFLAAISTGATMMNVDGDLGRHLTIGHHILSTLSVPTRDVFSHTLAGAPLTPHEWLAQLIFATSESLFGQDGPVLLTAAVIATAFAFVYRRARNLSGAVVAPLLFTLVALASTQFHWLTRPHIFTFLFLALWLLALDHLWRNPRRAWWQLPLLMLLWCNTHGAFLAGFVTWALYGAGLMWNRYGPGAAKDAAPPSFTRYYLLAGGAAALVSLLNPAGPGLWLTSVGYVGNAYLVGGTREYAAPDFHLSGFWPLAGLITLLVIWLGFSRRAASAQHLFPAAAWLLMTLYSARNAPLFAIVVAPLLALLARGWLDDSLEAHRAVRGWLALESRMLELHRHLRVGAVAVLIVVLTVVALRSGVRLSLDGRPNAFDVRIFPVRAVDWMQRSNVGGNGFNYFTWGGYLLYRTWPEQRVFIDGQTDFYGEALTRDYVRAINAAPGWEDVLRVHDVRWVLLRPSDPLIRKLRVHSAWRLAYADDTAVVYTRVP